ncbi:MAG: hypothetical protein AABZ15_15185 [Nitrospirota bacterium]
MAQERNQQKRTELERVIEKNRSFVDTATRELRKALRDASALQRVPLKVVQEVLQLYRSMRSRILEIDSVQQLLAHQLGRAVPTNERREQMIAELDEQIRVLCSRVVEDETGTGEECIKETARIEHQVRPPAEQWLRHGENSVAFTASSRLIDALDYPPPPPVRKAGQKQTPRQIKKEGRGFTLFSIRGPAPALDAIHSSLEIRERDIVERYGVGEIRGVMTNLHALSRKEVADVFERLLSPRYPDVRCVLVLLLTPDDLNEEFLRFLDRTFLNMRPGELRTVDLT